MLINPSHRGAVCGSGQSHLTACICVCVCVYAKHSRSSLLLTMLWKLWTLHYITYQHPAF